MGDKSDNGGKSHTRVSRISATEASRAFSAILDEIEAGRRFLVHRHGRDICVMTPPPLDGRRASECLGLLSGRAPVLLDGCFGRDLLHILAAEPAEERPSWDS